MKTQQKKINLIVLALALTVTSSSFLCSNQFFVVAQNGQSSASSAASAASGVMNPDQVDGGGGGGGSGSSSGSTLGASLTTTVGNASLNLGLNSASSTSAAGAGSAGGSGGSGGSSSSGASLYSGGSTAAAAAASSSASGSDSTGSSSAASAASGSSSSDSSKESLLGKMKDLYRDGKSKIIGDGRKDGSSSSGSGSASSGISGAIASASSTISDTLGGKGESNVLSKAAELLKSKKEAVKETIKENVIDPLKGKESKDSALNKLVKVVAKGTETVKEAVHKLEDKAYEFENKVGKVVDDHILKPMGTTSGSGQKLPEGQMGRETAVSSGLVGEERMNYLEQLRKQQETQILRPTSIRTIINEARAKGVIPQMEDQTALKANRPGEKTITAEVFDKAHELSKIPIETVLKPIDKMLGYEKDPLLRMYDNTHEILSKSVNAIAKPVETVVVGAFRTTDESKKETERLLSTQNEVVRGEAQAEAEKLRGRSVVGGILDKTVDLSLKPLEMLLKPADHLLGLDKSKKRNPILEVLEKIYGISKKPVDLVAKPFESILRKMGEGDQLVQASIRVSQGDEDPKLITRMADGLVNVANRIISKPMEIVMKPMNKILGFEDPDKKNPYVASANALKNATKVGIELFTKPLDRIIKEISDLGDNMSEAEREMEWRRQQEEASRLVMIIDKFHQVIQKPFEIVLRPVDKVLGLSNQESQKGPLMSAWDFIYQVWRTPIQVLGKPIEDALLGERRVERKNKSGASAAATSVTSTTTSTSAAASSSAGSGGAAAASAASGSTSTASTSTTTATVSAGRGQLFGEPLKRNHIIEKIKVAEKIALKPLDVVTKPIRKLILGQDEERAGSLLDVANRETQARARATVGASSALGQTIITTNLRHDQDEPDKIIRTIEKMNNVALKPLEYLTQPISDYIWHEKNGLKGGAKASASVSTSTSSAAASAQTSNNKQPQQPQQQQTGQQSGAASAAAATSTTVQTQPDQPQSSQTVTSTAAVAAQSQNNQQRADGAQSGSAAAAAAATGASGGGGVGGSSAVSVASSQSQQPQQQQQQGGSSGSASSAAAAASAASGSQGNRRNFNQ